MRLAVGLGWALRRFALGGPVHGHGPRDLIERGSPVVRLQTLFAR